MVGGKIVIPGDVSERLVRKGSRVEVRVPVQESPVLRNVLQDKTRCSQSQRRAQRRGKVPDKEARDDPHGLQARIDRIRNRS